MPLNQTLFDIVKPLKIESAASGGGQDDTGPTETSPTEDYIASKGLAFNGLEDTYIDKDPSSGEMRFEDPINGTLLLSELIGGGGSTGNVDGGHANSIYGGIPIINGGNA